MRAKVKVASKLQVTVRFVGSGAKAALDVTVTNVQSGAVQKDLIPIRVANASEPADATVDQENESIITDGKEGGAL